MIKKLVVGVALTLLAPFADAQRVHSDEDDDEVETSEEPKDEAQTEPAPPLAPVPRPVQQTARPAVSRDDPVEAPPPEPSRQASDADTGTALGGAGISRGGSDSGPSAPTRSKFSAGSASGGEAAAPSSAPGSVPGSCFGRSVVSGDLDSEAYMKSDKGEGFGPDFRTRMNVMHIMRFKTDAAGYMMEGWVIYDEEFQLTAFVSPSPCDYTWAYQHGTVSQSHLLLPVLTDRQAAALYAKPKNRIDGHKPWHGLKKNAHLLPDTYYYLHIVNASGKYTSNADLAAAPESCRGNRGNGNCYYLRLTFQTKNPGGPSPFPPDIVSPSSKAPPSGGSANAPPGGSGDPGSAPPDNSTCALPNGTSLPAGSENSKLLWYKNGTTCIPASFYCANGTLTYGLQFSPAPPRPAPGAALFMNQASCY